MNVKNNFNNPKNSNTGLKFNVIALISSIALVAILSLSSTLIFKNFSSQNSIRTPDIDPNADIYQGEEIEATEPGQMSIAGYSKATIPANQTTVPLLLRNPQTNQDKVYFSYDLILEDTGEVLYSSKMVPAGQAITQITLSRPLPAGVYNAAVLWKSYLIDNNLSEGNSVNMKLELTVV